MSPALTSAEAQRPEDPSDERFRAMLAAARPALLAFARTINAAGAEDLCQETLTRALLYRHTFQVQRPILPWLRVSLMRAAVDLARDCARRDRERAHEEEPRAPLTNNNEIHAQRVSALLATLEPVDAQLLRGFHLEGHSIAQLAQATGLAQGSVRSRLHRTRKRLAESSQDQEDPS